MLHFRVERKKESYCYRANSDKPHGFDNNWNNNSLDSLFLFDDLEMKIKLNCQTVANYCFGPNAGPKNNPHISTIASGDFTVKAFVEPRSFHGEIHAITRTRDIGGNWIDHNAMQVYAEGYQLGRWLIHDKYSFELKRDTNYAWSAGCFILSSADLQTLNKCMKGLGVKPGDLIQGTLVENQYPY
jgi:hypothetical protein